MNSSLQKKKECWSGSKKTHFNYNSKRFSKMSSEVFIIEKWKKKFQFILSSCPRFVCLVVTSWKWWTRFFLLLLYFKPFLFILAASIQFLLHSIKWGRRKKSYLIKISQLEDIFLAFLLVNYCYYSLKFD